jgi:NADH-quinone oxidoreductase subunit M
MVGGAAAWIAGKWSSILPRYISLGTILLDTIILLTFVARGGLSAGKPWIIEYNADWIPRFGINFHLSMDGLTMLMLFLTFFIGLIAVLISWKEMQEKTGFFHFNILWILAGITGVFLSMDLFLFYFFWEVMLIPMYFLIGIWGNEKRINASYKFFLFTQASGLLMFLAILGLYLVHGSTTGIYTFDYQQLIGTQMSSTMEMLLMLGFLAAFLVKLPVVPFHSWLPDTYTEAPMAGTLILSSVMSKTAAYGLLRFVIPLFPKAVESFAPIGMILGIVGILYGAKLAFAQTDLKRLVAWSSVNHMGFIVLGVFAVNELAYQGVIMQIIAHGVSTGALFVIAGILAERMKAREISVMGGLWTEVPMLGSVGLIFVMASLGLPGMGNFIAEFLILVGTFKSNVALASIASVGLIAGTIYAIRIMQKVFFGKQNSVGKMNDLSVRESIILGAMVIAIFILGLFPRPVLDSAKPAVLKILHANEKTVL